MKEDKEVMVLQEIAGVFGSWRDGHDALRALQSAGLRRDDALLYHAGRRKLDMQSTCPTEIDEDSAEYVAHGEHQGVTTSNRFALNTVVVVSPTTPQLAANDASPQRTAYSTQNEQPIHTKSKYPSA